MSVLGGARSQPDSLVQQRFDALAQQSGRLPSAFGQAIHRLFDLVRDLKLTESELDDVVAFLNDVSLHTDRHRQEWVVLLDALGLTTHVHDQNSNQLTEVTRSTVAGPFFRNGAPHYENGASICGKSEGMALRVAGEVTGRGGQPIARASVEVWHANADGLYENQAPDTQPDFNLRGRFTTDARGRFGFRTIRPAGYTLPNDGPVGALFERLGLTLARPAHLHFRVSADGYRTLTTQVFDERDRQSADAMDIIRPELCRPFLVAADGSASVAVSFVLAPASPNSVNQQT